MIQVTIDRTSADVCTGFCLEGHAGAAEEGQDIVCAAVSVLVLNTVNSIERFTKDPIRYEAAEDGGYLNVSFPTAPSRASVLLLRSMIAGLRDVEQQYGSEYIRIRYREGRELC